MCLRAGCLLAGWDLFLIDARAVPWWHTTQQCVFLARRLSRNAAQHTNETLVAIPYVPACLCCSWHDGQLLTRYAYLSGALSGVTEGVAFGPFQVIKV